MTFDYDEQIVSCLHKDAWGYRPTQDWWSWWNAATDTQKQVEWDILLDQMEQSQSEETRMKEAALDNLNNKINMVKSLSSTPMSTYDALRWLVQSESPDEFDLTYGASHFAYIWGIDFNSEYEDTLQTICDDMLMVINEGPDAHPNQCNVQYNFKPMLIEELV